MIFPIAQKKLSKKIFIICSGAGKIKRGFESSAQNLYNKLLSENLDVYLIKGGGESKNNEVHILNIDRYSTLNKLICLLVMNKQKKYVIEFLSFSLLFTPYLLIKKPKVIYVLEAPVLKYLLFLKDKLKLDYNLIYHTGGQLINQRGSRDVILHLVTPYYFEKALSCGFRKENLKIIPRFLDINPKKLFFKHSCIAKFKITNKLPLDKKILISVGSLDFSVKRMDYVIKEIEQLKNEYFLLMLGQFSEETEYIYNLAKQKLGEQNFLMKTVSRNEIDYYYQASDIFVLASLMEGFGLVYIEALANGLAVIAHDFENSRFVLKDYGIYLDLSKEGNLKNFLKSYKPDLSLDTKQKRFEFVYHNYSWDALKLDYLKLFEIND